MTGSVSVIIPTYNSGHLVAEAIESALSQTMPPTEIIVIDDGSRDDTRKRLDAFAGRIRYVFQENQGAAAARNHGIALATSEIVAFLDADDAWEPAKLARQVEVFRCQPQVGLVASGYYLAWPGQERISQSFENPCFLNRVVCASGEEVFRVARHIWTGAVAIRRELLVTHRFTSGLEPAEDLDLWIRLVASAPVYILDEPLATYVQSVGSLSNASCDRDCGNFLRVVRRHAALLGSAGLRHWEAIAFRRWAWNHLNRGDARAALWPAWQRLRREPVGANSWWTLARSLGGIIRGGRRRGRPAPGADVSTVVCNRREISSVS